MVRRIAIFLIVCFRSIFLFSQEQKEIDSLENCLKTKLQDTTRLNTLLQLSNYYRFAEPSKGKLFGKLAVESAIKNKRQKSLGEAYHYLASSYYQVANYDSSQIINELALAVRLKINDEKGLAGTYTNLGQIVGDKGNASLAFNYLYTAEKIY